MAEGIGIHTSAAAPGALDGHRHLASPLRVALEDLSAAWRQRALWLRLGHRELRRRYRRTVLGPFWATGHIALYVLFVGFVFSRVLSLAPSQYIPYLTTGLIAWTLLYAVMSEATTALTGAAGIRQHVPFPYSLFVLAMLWRNLIVHAHHYVLYVLLILLYPVGLSWHLLLLMPGYLLLIGNLAWIAFAIAVLSARYRDVAQLVANALQIMVFATPIFYRPEMLSEAQQVYLLMPNLLHHLAVVIRAPLLAEVPPLSSYLVLVAALIAGTLATAWLFGRRRHVLVFWIT
ncbi:MAG TPA: ABC transporter permease [Hyphomicrobiaceae bacterium]|nr:ABC transporter permease [Hyphomicrobiaceae bacterium]